MGIPIIAKHIAGQGRSIQIYFFELSCSPSRVPSHSPNPITVSVASHAYFSLEKYQEAVDAYEKGLSLDPQNPTMKSSLATAQAKLQEQSTEAPQGGLGGMDLGSLLSNPAIMGMAQQMMQSGALDQLMNNPNMAQMWVVVFLIFAFLVGWYYVLVDIVV